MAGDYFRTGADDPLFSAFSGWVENGYSRISGEKKNATDLYSWRFCGKGPQQDILLCGMGRDSFDRIGRPYPLVILGMGPLPRCRKHWDLLPFVLETLWAQMAYMITKRHLDVTQLEEDIRRLPVPEEKWSRFESERKERWESRHPEVASDQSRIDTVIKQHGGADTAIIPIESRNEKDITSMAGLSLSLLKKGEKTMPGTIFLGGSLKGTYLAIFKQPLATADFSKLWTLGSAETAP
jgi:type VI secretion system protein VasJ